MSSRFIGTNGLTKLITLVKTLISTKQDKLTFDSSPTANSSNPVTSGGLKTAIDNIDKVFIATYNSTTYSEISSAYSAGKLVFLDYGGYLCPLYKVNSSYASFIWPCTNTSDPRVSYTTVTSSNVWNDGSDTIYLAKATHAHGNITSAGALQTTDISIASGDKLVVTDSSNSNKVARTSVSFDGSTTTKYLSPKGTWENVPNEIFIAEYGVTTYTEIETAYNAGKLCMLNYDWGNEGTYVYPFYLYGHEENSFLFQCVYAPPNGSAQTVRQIITIECIDENNVADMWSEPIQYYLAAADHTHGNITNGGDITASAPTIANGDQLVINDDSASKITNGPTFDGSTTNKYLSPKGTWETIPSVPQAGTSSPNMDGTASAGTASTWSKSDHVHPTDTSRQSTIYRDTITTTTTWSGNGPYTQTVTLANYTATSNSKVDIQADDTALTQLLSDGVTAIYISNLNGTLTAHAIGAAPTVALTLQVTITEVTAAS